MSLPFRGLNFCHPHVVSGVVLLNADDGVFISYVPKNETSVWMRTSSFNRQQRLSIPRSLLCSVGITYSYCKGLPQWTKTCVESSFVLLRIFSGWQISCWTAPFYCKIFCSVLCYDNSRYPSAFLFFFSDLVDKCMKRWCSRFPIGVWIAPVQVHCGVTEILAVRGSSPWQGFQSWVVWMGSTDRDQLLLTQTCIGVFSGVVFFWLFVSLKFPF